MKDDPVTVFVSRTFWLWVVLSFLTFGSRPFTTGDRSTNYWLVGGLAGGEGWHNNHHAFQRSAFHGLHWWQFDAAGLTIRLLKRVKLITDVQRVDPALVAKRLAADTVRP